MTPRLDVFLGSAAGPAQLLHTAFARLDGELRRQGAFYVGVAPVRRAGDDLAAAVADQHALARASGRGCNRLLVVDEVPPTPGSAARRVGELIAAAGARSTCVVLVVERQDRLLDHACVEALAAGREPPEPGVVDHAAEVQLLRAVPGVHHVVVRPYELVHAGTLAFTEHALEQVGLRGLDLRRLQDVLVAYRSYSQTAADLARALRPELGSPAERQRVHEFLLESFGSPNGGRLVDAARRRAVLAAHRELNSEMFRMHIPDLPEDSYADEAATARLGTVLAPVRLPAPPYPVRARAAAGRVRRRVRAAP